MSRASYGVPAPVLHFWFCFSGFVDLPDEGMYLIFILLRKNVAGKGV